MNRIHFLAASLSCLLLFSCHTPDKKEETTDFLVSTPLVKDTLITRSYVAQIRAIQHIELKALEKGYLQRVFVDEGQMVKQGQAMFQIMPALYEAEVQKARAETEFAGIEYQNTASLHEKGIVSPNELALAKARLNKTKAEQSLAETHLGFTVVKAPFSGIMDRFQVRPGSLVNEGDWLTTLSDNSRMWVYFNVPEAEYLNYSLRQKKESGATVSLQMANQERFPLPGKVETIEADFNNETGNIAFRAGFPNPDRLLRHGETGTVLMETPLKNAILIPQKATFEVLEKKYVFTVGADKVVRQREIEVAYEMPDLYVLKSGLKPGERFIVEGIRKVRHEDKLAHYRYERPEVIARQLSVYVE